MDIHAMCECGHHYYEHYEEKLRCGCVGTKAGLPCKCTGFEWNKQERIEHLEREVRHLKFNTKVVGTVLLMVEKVYLEWLFSPERGQVAILALFDMIPAPRKAMLTEKFRSTPKS